MHSTQAVKVFLATDHQFESSVVGLSPTPVESGTLPAWWIIAEDSHRRFLVIRAIISDSTGECFFDNGSYDLDAVRAFELFERRVGESRVDAARAREAGVPISFDHGEAGFSARLP